MLIFISGNVGSGKTTLAKYAAKKLGYFYLNADMYKKEIYSLHPNPEQFFLEGRAVPAGIRAKLYEKLGSEFARLSKNHKNIILDETLHTQKGRKKLLSLGKKYFKNTLIILIKSSLAQVRLRNKAQRKKHLLKNTYRMHLSINKIARFYPKPDFILNNNHSLQQSKKKLILFLKRF